MKLGFIGCGNMAKAMLGGILKKERGEQRKCQKYLWNSGNSR